MYACNLYCLLTSSADPSLTVGNVAGVLNMMKRNWHYVAGRSLADHLDVPLSKQYEIRRQHQSQQQQHMALAEYTVSYVPGFSWARLTGALYYCEEEAALQAARRYIKREEGKLCAVAKLTVFITSYLCLVGLRLL